MPDFTAKPADQYNECPHCWSPNLVRQTGINEPTSHYGRLKCGDCKKHIQWLKDPSVSLQWQSRAGAIDKILSDHRTKLSQWDIDFLKSVRETRNLSERQQDKLNVIGLKTIGQRICAVPDAPPTLSKNPDRAKSRFT